MNILGYTDGVTDARSPVDELFTRSRLKTILTQPFASAGELIERVKSSVFNFISVAPHYEDVTDHAGGPAHGWKEPLKRRATHDKDNHG
jgi:hypothetical protein